jgi:hypothetical protein
VLLVLLLVVVLAVAIVLGLVLVLKAHRSTIHRSGFRRHKSFLRTTQQWQLHLDLLQIMLPQTRRVQCMLGVQVLQQQRMHHPARLVQCMTRLVGTVVVQQLTHL